MATEDNPDVEMKSAESTSTSDNKNNESEQKKDADLLALEDIREHIRLIAKAVSTKEPRFILRVLRLLPFTRKKLNPVVLARLVEAYYDKTDKSDLLNFVQAPGRKSDAVAGFRPRTGKSASTSYGMVLVPEEDAYIHLLILVHLVDSKSSKKIQCADSLIAKVSSGNRRTMDLLASRCYFYYSRCYELEGKLNLIRRFLHNRLRTSTLRNDYEGQAVLINCLLRNYLHHNLYAQADKLVSKCTFPKAASNNELARFLYYLGRIKATQLEYTEAKKHLLQALRKAPQHSAIGFKQHVQKLAIAVELLLGDIPERQIFSQDVMRQALIPYFQLTQAVRTGDIVQFGVVLDTHGSQFQKDHTYNLILRLRHNVIKTAIRMIGLSYSRISLKDIATKLMLDSPTDAEFMVAKAIRDGVIEATIDHNGGYMKSTEMLDVYCTREPQLAFHQRISFCLDIHNQSVKALRFPPKSYSKDLESVAERREREQQDLEYAKEMAEEDDDGFP
ncbi:unnamed protein product [Cyprideis torosa]|uniref:Probable 26S proteasome non-ATPase regulatory subunit 3 n=1 Tax=Cyprideis torosa TaxID=163714 RepID=A0A7R8W3M3_9CRUS|nr:unnamed protein product [Cyprideis torosa]CAG0883163.1 unnamed protein product [Cyprideis torosa]